MKKIFWQYAMALVAGLAFFAACEEPEQKDPDPIFPENEITKTVNAGVGLTAPDKTFEFTLDLDGNNVNFVFRRTNNTAAISYNAGEVLAIVAYVKTS